jgi:hypothetical protein
MHSIPRSFQHKLELKGYQLTRMREGTRTAWNCTHKDGREILVMGLDDWDCAIQIGALLHIDLL